MTHNETRISNERLEFLRSELLMVSGRQEGCSLDSDQSQEVYYALSELQELRAHPLPNPSPSDGEVISREEVMRVYETLNSGVPYSARECRVSYALHQLLFPTSILQAYKRGHP